MYESIKDIIEKFTFYYIYIKTDLRKFLDLRIQDLHSIIFILKLILTDFTKNL